MPYLQSAAIEAISYDEDNHVLCVRFREGGRIVVYENVPQEIYDALIFADSIGAFFRDRIESVYPVQRDRDPAAPVPPGSEEERPGSQRTASRSSSSAISNMRAR